MKKSVFAALCGLCATAAGAAEFAHSFSSSMVLARETEAPVWGRAEPGEIVRLTLIDAAGQPVFSRTAAAGADGVWRAKTARIAAGGPYSLRLAAKSGSCVLDDILFGDIWICGGQSNMEFGRGWGRSKGGMPEIAEGNFPHIRLFSVPRLLSGKVERDYPDALAWRVLSAADTNRFSSVGLFFAVNLDRYLDGKVPLGLVDVNWGGTIIEAWFDTETFLAANLGNERMRANARVESARGRVWQPGDSASKYPAEMRAAQAQYDSYAQVDAMRGPSALEFDLADWPQVKMPQPMEAHLGPDFDGIVYYVREFELTAAEASGKLEITLPPVDDFDEVYLNGVKVGSGIGWNVPRRYTVAPGAARAGRNRLLVRADDPGLGGGLDGDPKHSFAVKTASRRIPLAGEWRFAAFRQRGIRPIDYDHIVHPNFFSLGYNAMVAPLSPMAVKGAIWYQGCSNGDPQLYYDGEKAGDGARNYFDFFQTLKRSWRKTFTRMQNTPDEMAFYLVQIAPYDARHDKPVESDWAVVRDAQWRLGETPAGRPGEHDVGGTVFIGDVGEQHDIHPTDKRTVGRRLARLVACRSYGRADAAPTGPVPRRAALAAGGKKVEVNFDFAGQGLAVREGAQLGRFELAGATGGFVAVEARIASRGAVELTVPAGLAPRRVRYGWDKYPEIGLVNSDGTPATPFEFEVAAP